MRVILEFDSLAEAMPIILQKAVAENAGVTFTAPGDNVGNGQTPASGPAENTEKKKPGRPTNAEKEAKAAAEKAAGATGTPSVGANPAAGSASSTTDGKADEPEVFDPELYRPIGEMIARGVNVSKTTGEAGKELYAKLIETIAAFPSYIDGKPATTCKQWRKADYAAGLKLLTDLTVTAETRAARQPADLG